MRTVLNLNKGESGTIIEIADQKIKGRLLSMGVLPESSITLIRKSLFSNTFYIKLDGQNIALRRKEAAAIQLK